MQECMKAVVWRRKFNYNRYDLFRQTIPKHQNMTIKTKKVGDRDTATEIWVVHTINVLVLLLHWILWYCDNRFCVTRYSFFGIHVASGLQEQNFVHHLTIL